MTWKFVTALPWQVQSAQAAMVEAFLTPNNIGLLLVCMQEVVVNVWSHLQSSIHLHVCRRHGNACATYKDIILDAVCKSMTTCISDPVLSYVGPAVLVVRQSLLWLLPMQRH